MNKKILIPAIIVLFCFIGVLYSLSFKAHSNKAARGTIDKQVFTNFDKPISIGELSAESNLDQNFGFSSLQGKWTLLYIGSTTSPEFKITLQKINDIVERINPQLPTSDKLQTVILTATPATDSLSILSATVKSYPAITVVRSNAGDEINISAKLGSPISYNNDQKSIAHSFNLYVIDPSGKALGHFSFPLDINLVPLNFLKIIKCGPGLCLKSSI